MGLLKLFITFLHSAFWTTLFFVSTINVVRAQEVQFIEVLPEEDWRLRNVLHEVLYEIMTTPTGLQVASSILECDKTAIELYIGLLPPQAELISQKCFQTLTQNNSAPLYTVTKSPWILSSPLRILKKTFDVNLGSTISRNYSFMFTTSSNWSIDSWTQPAKNKTTLVLPVKSFDNLYVDKERLRYLLAHETAIYFDSKFWTGSHDFTRIIETQIWFPKYYYNSMAISLALDNPIIAFMLSAYRGFIMEQQFLSELGLVSPNQPISKSGLNYWLLQRPCSNTCLIEYLEKNISKLHKFMLPLIANSPSYRSRLFSYINSHPKLFNEDMSKIKDWIIDQPATFYEQNTKTDLHKLLEQANSHSNTKNHLIQDVMMSNFLTRKVLVWHLSILKEFLNEPIASGFSEFILTPLLSGYNSRMNSGPRPKIVVGGF